jgi:hypothetical protein
MPSRLGPRFAIEAIFLVLVAVGVAFADLSAQWIVIVMAGAWLLTAAVEWLASRPPRVAQPVPAAASWPEAEIYAVAAPPQEELEVAEAGAASWPSEAFPPLPVVEEAEPSAPVDPDEPIVAAGEAEAPDPQVELEPVAPVEPDEPIVAAGEAEAPDPEVELEPVVPAAEPEASAEAAPAVDALVDDDEQEQPIAEPVPAAEAPAEPKRRFWRRRSEAVAVDEEGPPPEPELVVGAAAAAAAVIDAVVSDAPAEAAVDDEGAESSEADAPEPPKPRFWRRRAGEAALAAAAPSLAIPERDDSTPDDDPIGSQEAMLVDVAPEPLAAEPQEEEEEDAVDEPAPVVHAAPPAEEPPPPVEEPPPPVEEPPPPVEELAPLIDAPPVVEEPASVVDAAPVVDELTAPEVEEADVERRAEEEPVRRGRFWRRKGESDAGADAAAELGVVVPVPLEDDDGAIDAVESERVESVEEAPEREARKGFWRRKTVATPDGAADDAVGDVDAAPELAAAFAATTADESLLEDETLDDEVPEEDALEEEARQDEPAFVNGDASGALGEVKRSESLAHVPEPVVEARDEPLEDPEPDLQPAPALAAPRLMRRLPQPREWTIWELERAIREHAGADPERDRQWRMTLFDLRRHADRRGAIPVELDPLVRETFADLIEPAGGS